MIFKKGRKLSVKKYMSPKWWYGNIHWIIRTLSYETIYSLRWIISLVPGLIGRFLRRYCWGIRSVGKEVNIDEGCWISHPNNLVINDYVGINKGCRINCAGKIVIGSSTLLGPGVYIWSQNHNFMNKNIPFTQQGYEYKKVIIDEDVWVAARVTIMPGVTIGKGAIICAGAVVTKNVRPYTIVAGVPATYIGQRK